LTDIKAACDSLFDIYKALKRVRIREQSRVAKNPALLQKSLRDEADDYFLIFMALRQIIMEDEHGYEERKIKLVSRFNEAEARLV
jgi:hypothetical protein